MVLVVSGSIPVSGSLSLYPDPCPCIRIPVPVSGTLSLYPDPCPCIRILSLEPVPSTRYLVSGNRYLGPGTWYQVPGTKYQVPGTRYLVPARLAGWLAGWPRLGEAGGTPPTAVGGTRGGEEQYQPFKDIE